MISGATMVDYTQADGTANQYLLVKIPFRSHAGFKKSGTLVQEALEAKYEKTVIVVANRTIISDSGKYNSFATMEKEF